MCWRRAVLGLGCLFAIACDEPTGLQVAALGSLRVTVSTTGPDPDPDGYFVIIDGLQLTTIGASAQWIDTTVRVGQHDVLLGGTAANCTVSPNPVTVQVKAHTITTATFAVQCVSTHGSVHITPATSGVDLDPDRHLLCVDPYESYYRTTCTYGQSIAANRAVTLACSARRQRAPLNSTDANSAM